MFTIFHSPLRYARPSRTGGKLLVVWFTMSAAVFYIAIVVIWAAVLVPRWL